MMDYSVGTRYAPPIEVVRRDAALTGPIGNDESEVSTSLRFAAPYWLDAAATVPCSDIRSIMPCKVV